MRRPLFTQTRSGATSPIARIDDTTRVYIAHSQAANTQRAYRADWRHFEQWCAGKGLVALPAAPETVACYLAALASAGRHKVSTISRRLAAISKAHAVADHVPVTKAPIVRLTLQGIRRDLGTSPDRKAAIRAREISNYLATWQPQTLADLRDRAMLLLCYAGAFRRSELAAIRVEDLEALETGVSVFVPRSKTDPFGEGMNKDIHYTEHSYHCPVRALEAWLAAAGITSGPLFRPIDRHGNVGTKPLTPQSIMLITKRFASEFGMNPKDIGAHSLRAGMVTDLFAGGVQETVIKQLTGHRDSKTLEVYRREAKRMTFNYIQAAGLE